jgi:predicted transcriptional regulator of viral defense system
VRTPNHAEQIVNLVRRNGLIRARELTPLQIPRATLTRMVRTGRLTQISRGLYALTEQIRSEFHPFAEVAHRSPLGVFCLLSALRFHQLTTQSPPEVWLAIPNKARAPKIDYPPLHIVRFSGGALTQGIERHIVDGVSIRVYSVAKTIADCFKYRNKIGLDVALEALRESRREKRATVDELWRYAKVCRIATVIRPYLESLE